MKVDPFIEAENVAGHNVAKACGLLEVPRAAYYERRNGAPSRREVTDAVLLAKITAIHTQFKGTYGSPASTRSCANARSPAEGGDQAHAPGRPRGTLQEALAQDHGR